MAETETEGLPQVEIAAIVMDDKGHVLLGRAPEGADKDKVTVPIGRIRPFEAMSDAAVRIVAEWAQTEIAPQHAIFVCESIHQERQEHRVVVFIFSKATSPTLSRKELGGNVMWVDVRDLGQYQDEMSDLAADGFYKLSLVLRQQAAAKGQ
jgi:ADP-ribose pyrophosphatase YjhB (NUDIX family)